jgi:ADP-dependent NAD(P)H-hydrate dehydratase
VYLRPYYENVEPRVIDRRLLRTMPLPVPSDKDERGKLLIVAGSEPLPGGAILPAAAALRVGCGTVRVALPPSLSLAVGTAVPELMIVGREELAHHLAACAAVVAGPGMVEDAAGDRLLAELIADCPLPLVVDARALYVWADRRPKRMAGPRVFTPHARELSEMLRRPVDELVADRSATASAFAADHGVTFVFKGARTVIAAPDGGLFVNKAGSRGLGTAGSGDTLAGIIGGFLAQGLAAAEAAVWGVSVHALAGELVAAELGDDGVMASDLLPKLPLVLRRLRR